MGEVVDGFGGTGLVAGPGSVTPPELGDPVELPEPCEASPTGTKESHATTLSDNKTTHPRVQSIAHRDTRDRRRESPRYGNGYRVWKSFPKKYVSEPPK